jgi:hypothetical protein
LIKDYAREPKIGADAPFDHLEVLLYWSIQTQCPRTFKFHRGLRVINEAVVAQIPCGV